MISAEEPDWSREAKTMGSWDPARSLLRSIRSYQRATGSLGRLEKPSPLMR